jgi:tetratricopeptide (TPR) repeat protein
MPLRRGWRLAGGIVIPLLFALAVAFGAGSLRYGGPQGLWLRARAELDARRPHPLYVPTPYLAGSPVAVARLSLSDGGSSGGANATATATAAATFAPSVTSQPLPLPGAGGSTATSPIDTPMPASLTVTGKNLPASIPTPTLTTVPTAAASPTPAYAPAAPQVDLTGVKHAWQTWNNCGPDTLASYLSYYGSSLSQADIAAVLRPNADDKNVDPGEMVDFARAQGYQALVRVNGDADRLRLLLSNGVPVMIETWLEPKPNDGMGHYRLLTGYDDGRREWTVYDSYVATGVERNAPYHGIRLSYAELDDLWAVFDRTYILIYTPAQAARVQAILGADMDEPSMWQRDLQRHEGEVVAASPSNYQLFNLGTDLVALGRFAEAAAAYDQARLAGLPWRMLWYQFGPFRAYYETGRYDEVIRLADATQASAGGQIEELYYWKGLALQANGQLAGARQAWEQALKLNPHYADPAAALKSSAN